MLNKGAYTKEDKETVHKMREGGCGYNEIAKTLNRSLSSIGTFCRRNNIGGYNKSEANNPELAIEYFLKKIDKFYQGRYEYVDGYIDCESPVRLKCLVCNSVVPFSAKTIRSGKPAHCQECKSAKKERELAYENITRLLKNKIRQENMKVITAERLKLRTESLTKACELCGETFVARRINAMFCSKECQIKKNNRAKGIRKRMKLRRNGVPDLGISIERIANRDGRECYLCGEECDFNDYYYTKGGYYITGGNHPSVEHVIPLSKGGTHTWDNVKLAHCYCNTMKRDKVLKTKESMVEARV